MVAEDLSPRRRGAATTTTLNRPCRSSSECGRRCADSVQHEVDPAPEGDAIDHDSAHQRPRSPILEGCIRRHLGVTLYMSVRRLTLPAAAARRMTFDQLVHRHAVERRIRQPFDDTYTVACGQHNSIKDRFHHALRNPLDGVSDSAECRCSQMIAEWSG
jgi:hypothetical protein